MSKHPQHALLSQFERTAIRCAIYTRVSTDERLGQEFNSLDNQDSSEVLDGILQVARIPGLLASLDQFYEAADEHGQDWREFIETWWDHLEDSPPSPSAAVQISRRRQ